MDGKFDESDVVSLFPPFKDKWVGAPMKVKNFDKPFTPRAENMPIGNTLNLHTYTLLSLWLSMVGDSFSYIIKQTNVYGVKKFGSVWKEVDFVQFVEFVGITLHMSIVKMAGTHDTWK